jgi:glucose-6-phosphate-specific signal transduction histidine kinase
MTNVSKREKNNENVREQKSFLGLILIWYFFFFFFSGKIDFTCNKEMDKFISTPLLLSAIVVATSLSYAYLRMSVN